MSNNYFEKEKENFENFKECSTNLSKSTAENSEYLNENSKIENNGSLTFMENSFYKLFLYDKDSQTIRDNNRFCKDNCVLPPEFFIDIPQIFELAFYDIYDSDDEVKIKKEEMQIDVKITEKNKELEVNFKPKITDASSNILLLRRTFKEVNLELVKEIVINSKNTDQLEKAGVKMIFNLQKEFQKKKGFLRGGKKKNKVKRKTIKNNRKQSKKKINNNNNNSRKVKKKKN